MPSLALLFATAPPPAVVPPDAVTGGKRSGLAARRRRGRRVTGRARAAKQRAAGGRGRRRLGLRLVPPGRRYTFEWTRPSTGCGLFAQHGQRLVRRCVDCHMPALTSTVISGSVVGRELRVRVRTHWIKVYPLAEPVSAPYDSRRP